MDKMVFIVEDDLIQQKVLQKHFETMVGNFKVKTFAHPDAMIAHLNENPFAIVLDHFYGIESTKTGLDYLTILKKKYSSIPVIYYTSSDDKQLPEKVLKLGATKYIYKDSASFVRLRSALDELEQQGGRNKGFLSKLFKR